jgi:predicted metalloprotease with PDZ domain
MKRVALALTLGLLMAAGVQAAEPQHRGALGVTMSNNEGGGVLVTGVYQGSPASRMGLQVGDQIVTVNGKDVADFKEVIDIIGSCEPGSKVAVRVDRAGWRNNLSVTVGDADQVFQAQVNRPMMSISQRVDVRELERQNILLKQEVEALRATQMSRDAARRQEANDIERWWERGQHGLNGNDPALFQ